MVFETEHLIIRKAVPSAEDIELFYSLWTNPRVMCNVGFPEGLAISRDKIRRIIEQEDDPVFESKLIITVKSRHRRIGECKLGRPNALDIAVTDIKLLPEYWGCGYGTETKRGLVAYLFTNTACKAIRATPGKNNFASQKMQEAVGGKIVGEGVYRFEPGQAQKTEDVPYFIYQVSREDWQKTGQSDDNKPR